jgi:hypothetical protein
MPSSDYQRLRDFVESKDPELIGAADEVDISLLRWALSLSPRERLQASSGALSVLSGFQRQRERD